MGNDFSKLSYDQILSIANQLNMNATSMQELLTEIETLFNKVGTDEVWSGTAASQTKDNFNQLSRKFPEFYNAITECSSYLKQMVSNYQSVDQMISGQQ